MDSVLPAWFKSVMVVLAGMILLLLADAPRDANHPSWRTNLADPLTLRLAGAAIIGAGVYWGFVNYQRKTKRRRQRSR